jgi:hypothetical protein
MYKARKIKKSMYYLRNIIISFAIITLFYFSICMAIPPEESLLQHTIPFLFMIVGLTFFSLMNLFYYLKIVVMPRPIRIYIICYSLILIATTVIYLSKILSSLFDFYIPPISIGISFDTLWTILNSIFPMFHARYLIKHTPPMTFRVQT